VSSWLSPVLIIPLFTGVTIKETQMKAASTFFLPPGAGLYLDLCEAACRLSIPIDKGCYKSRKAGTRLTDVDSGCVSGRVPKVNAQLFPFF
jgi:hypothetical protein